VITNQFNPFVRQDANYDSRMQELLKGSPESQRLLKTVPEHQQFITKSGRPISSIKELITLIKELSPQDYDVHVTTMRNDFAIWIHESVSDDDVTQKAK